MALTASPNTPINIPPLSVPGTYTVEEIRLESGGQVLMRGVPESVAIDVIEKLLVTKVTADPLTAQQIRDKGIVFDKSSFQAYNFTAAFAVQDTPVNISFPVVLPTLQGAQDATVPAANGASLVTPTLPSLATIVPDTLKLQTQIPNLKVVGFALTVGDVQGKTLAVPPIPGVVVIPGDIGFLNQFFSVKLFVGNAGPAGSNLVVRDLKGEILLPAGRDKVVGSDDDPLRMAQTASGESPRVQPIVQPGPDGQVGTADDIPTLTPGESGVAEYLVEGRREGTSVIEFAITGTLDGLPGGPTAISGRASGSVLVRNPTFTLTFTHPDVVSAGDAYSLDVTVTNTSQSPANFVSVNLFSQNVSGATVAGNPSQQIDSIAPGDSQTVSFDLVARVTGKVTAATIDSDEQVSGKFSLTSQVGADGIPASPDSLVLPREANGLPADVRAAVLGLLGKAWAVATAPAAALPPNVKRLSKQVVYDRAVQAAEAGLRISLHEPVSDSVAALEMDYIGADYGRLASFHVDPGELARAQADFMAFDDLRRASPRGDALASAIAAHFASALAAGGASAFHRNLASQAAYRPPFLSVLVSSGGSALPFAVRLVDAQGRRLGGSVAPGQSIREIPFGDALSFGAPSAATAQLLLVGTPGAGDYHLQFTPMAGVAPDAPFIVSLIVPGAGGGLRQIVYDGLTGTSAAVSPFVAGDAYRVLLDLPIGNVPPAATVVPSADADSVLVPPSPTVISAVQQADKDLSSCSSIPLGRVIAVLFSGEVTPESVQDRLAASSITNYAVDNNAVVGVALQPGRRIAFVGLRDPVGPFIARSLTIVGVSDAAGHAMSSQTVPIETTIATTGAVVSGQILGADGAAVPFASVRMFILDPSCGLAGVSSKLADQDGRYSWDFVPAGPDGEGFPPNRITAVDPVSNDSRQVDFGVQRSGQRLNVNVVFLGRGTFTGRTLAEDRTPLANSVVKITSLTDQSSYEAQSDDLGRFSVGRVPVGNILVEAVNTAANAKGSISDLIPLSGGTVSRDMTLFSVSHPTVVIRNGNATGHVLRGDGTSPVAGAPVIAYYRSGSQAGVNCPPGQPECAVAVVNTAADGRFELDQITAGQIHLVTFDQPTFQQGDAVVTVIENQTVDASILLGAGLGTVNGSVVDGAGVPVAGAQVGGGLSLATTDAQGHFTLTDVPVGHRELVAVDNTSGRQASAFVDILQAGQTVNVTIVLPATATITGTVFEAGGTVPVPNQTVYLFFNAGSDDEPRINVIATAATDAAGHYSMTNLTLRDDYVLSAFRRDFSDGNVKPAPLKFKGQVFRGDIVFRGAGGRVNGHVLNADGTAGLRAAVGLSGDQVVIAGGLVGVHFERVANYQIVNTDLTTGAFSFTNLFVGPFTVSAVGAFSPDPIAFEGSIPSPGAIANVELRLQGTSTVRGVVLQPDGVTPAGKNVVVHYKSSAHKTVCATGGSITLGTTTIDAGTCADIPQGIQEETAVTDDAGHFEVPLVNAGEFSLIADDPATGRTGQALGSIRAGQTGDFTVRLLGLSTLTVKVRGSDTTTQIPGARVDIKQISFPNKSFSGTADSSGTLVLSGGDAFTEGDITVFASDLRNGFAGRAAGHVTKDGDNVTITVLLFNASGTVLGSVFAPDGVTPIPNAEVVISNGSGALAFDVTDGEGNYRQDQIPLGAFRVDVFVAATGRRGFASGRIDLDHEQVPVTVLEAPRGLVTGAAYQAGTLAALKNWQVFLQQQAPGGRQLPTLQATTDVDGTYEFPGVTAGDFHVSVLKFTQDPTEPQGSGDVNATLVTDGQHLDLPIIVNTHQRRFGRVEGTVFNPDGTAASNVAVSVCASEVCSQPFGPGSLGAVTGPDGAFGLDNVVTGRFTIAARSQVTQDATSGTGQLLFAGDLARMTLTLTGTSQISGTVVTGAGQPAANTQVFLSGYPSSGCPQTIQCIAFTDDTGAFSFINVPAKTYWIMVQNAVSGLRGYAAGSLTPGDHPSLRIVLQATTSVSGRAVHESGSPASGITAELDGRDPNNGFAPIQIFQVTGADGRFQFTGVPPADFALTLQDPLGSGIAQRSVHSAADIDVGDVTLDEFNPSVLSVTPQSGAIQVPLTSTVRIVFSEPLSPGSVTPSTVVLSGPSGPVVSVLQVVDGDTTVVITPVAPLKEQTKYTVGIQGVTDRVGKTLAAPYSTAFTTIDKTPPAIVDATPASGHTGIALDSVVRIKFSEPVAPGGFQGDAITLLKGGVTIAGQNSFAFGNTTAVFTPAFQLEENTEYTVRVQPAVDLVGNAQSQPTAYVFRTLDRTPPAVAALHVGGNGTVIENGIVSVVAEIGGGHDISVVDFSINDQPGFAARTSPFTVSLQALPSLGKPGDRIKVSAIATDTSGNRGTTPATVFIPVVADAPPSVTITSPPPASAFHTGDRVTVTVQVSDDLGATDVSYRAATGKPQDAGSQKIAPAATTTTQTFAFSIGADAVPGSPIAIDASAVDTKGQLAHASPVSITVLDKTPPVVTITGTSTGAKVAPGQQTSAIVSAQDLGGIASISFTTTGPLSGTQTRNISPAQPSVAAAFAFTIPATAQAGDVLTLDATATDAAGNVASAARVLLPIADLNPPVVHLHTPTGGIDITPGSFATILADADDETGVQSVTLAAQGAFSVSQAQQVSPVSNSPRLTFQVPVPASAADGAALNVSATAIDIFGNVSAPATLTLTVRSSAGVTLPASTLVAAGETTTVDVTLSSPAPSGGLEVDLASADPNIAQVTSAVTFAPGETSRSITITGVAGGTVSVTASVHATPRASMTVVVRGGVVSGTVFNPQLQPVAGAVVNVVVGSTAIQTITDGTGRYHVEGVVPGSFATFSVRVVDPATNLIGFATASLSSPTGFAHVNVVLVTAGSIGGTVFAADGHTPAPTGTRVDLLASTLSADPLATVFTDANGAYSFDIVSPGSYVVDASDHNGNHGRSTTLSLSTTGQHLDAPVVFLGRGSVVGTVFDGNGNPAANLPISLSSRSIFDVGPFVQSSTAADGTFRFDGVFAGSVTVQATDSVTGFSGSASGTIVSDGQVVRLDIHLTQSANLVGVVTRFDGVTPVAGASLYLQVTGTSTSYFFFTKTGTDGHYRFDRVPLGTYLTQVNDASTLGFAYASGTLSANGQTVTQNISLFGQGTIIATVLDGAGAPVPNALVYATSSDSRGGAGTAQAPTNADGVLVIEHVYASNFVTVNALSNGRTGFVTTTLQPNEVKPVTVHLEPTGTILGTVYRPDGQTPATDALVNGVPVNADGTYRIDNLRIGSWTVTITDGQQRRRAIARDIRITAGGQVVTQNFTYVGLGTVTGRVLNPDNSSAPNIFVNIQNPDPDLGSISGVRTDAGGFYLVENFPAGLIKVSAGDQLRGLLGEASGTLAHDGDTLTLDILLKNNAVNLPISKNDGNGFMFDVQKDGSIANGHDSIYGFAQCCGLPNAGGAMYLDVIAGGTATRFTGSNVGTTESDGHEVVVSQTGVGGLNVTRKILVAPEYFARYLELLTNPTLNPITIDVRITSNVHGVGANDLWATSSGDAVFDVTNAANPDRWLAINTGTEGDPFSPLSPRGVTQIGFAFDGPGAARRVGATSYSTSSQVGAQLTYGWTSVTIPPGQTAAFMHVAVQQYSRAALQASLERLVQIPPEMLQSLSTTELAAIQNFAVHGDGTSDVAGLPPFGGTISGLVLEADHTTPVSSVDAFGTTEQNIRFRSGLVYMGRTYRTSASQAGAFTFGAGITVPRTSFTLEADELQTHVTSPSAAGDFAIGSATAIANIVFNNTGILTGTVRRTSGAVVPNAAVSLALSPGSDTSFKRSGTDGRFFAPGILPGSYTFVATLTHPQAINFSLTGSAPVTVTAGETHDITVTIQPTGALAGIVRNSFNAPGVNVPVRLILSGTPTAPVSWLQTTTDSAGGYRFNDVPVGAFTVQATDPLTAFVTSGTATIVQDQTTSLDLQLIAYGSVRVSVTFTNGQPVQNAFVQIQRSVDTFFQGVGSTDATGTFVVPNVSVGAFTVRVLRPGNTNVANLASGTVTAQDQIVPIGVVVTPVGSVLVQVNNTSGGPVAGAIVNMDTPAPGAFIEYGSTDTGGRLAIPNVVGDRTYVIRVSSASNRADYRESTARVTAEGQAVAVTIVLGAVGSVSGTVTSIDGRPAPSLLVQVVTDSPAQFFATNTDAAGHYAVGGLPTGNFRVLVRSIDSTFGGSFAGRVVANGDALVGNIVTGDPVLPAVLTDANGFQYTVQPGASLTAQTTDDNQQIPSGWMLNAGPPDAGLQPFIGDFAATAELSGRQLAIRDFRQGSAGAQQSIAGSVFVTRKVYVPVSGYFARYLEIFDNPTSAAATLDVRTDTLLGATRIAATSSGDVVPSATDAWFVADAPGTPSMPAVAHVFGGAGAAIEIGEIQQNGTFDVQPTEIWKSVVVPAGGRVALMHFVVQEPTAASAQAAAERLVQLPPEALAGLSPDEIAAIRNFVVPANGLSTLPAFATVAGTVTAGDGVTPIANAIVSVTSAGSTIFKSTVTAVTDSAGHYSVSTLLPGSFTAQAIDQATGVLTPAVQGGIGAADSIVIANLSFTSAGILTGTAMFPNGQHATGGTVFVSSGSPVINASATIGADGRYFVGTLPPALYTAQWNAGSGGFGQPTRFATVTGIAVTAGHTTIADLRLTAIATVRLTVHRSDGSPFAGVFANVQDSQSTSFRNAGSTNTSGVLTISSVPEGPFTIQIVSINPNAVLGTVTGSVVPGDEGGIVDVAFTAFAPAVRGFVFARDGVAPIPSALVQLWDSHDHFVNLTTSQVDGSYAFDNFTLPDGGPGVKVIAYSPSNSRITVTGTGTVGGPPTVINLSLPVVTLTGRLTYVDGTVPVAGSAFIEIAQENASGRIDDTSTSVGANGNFSILTVSGPFEVRAQDSAGLLVAFSDGVIPDVGNPAPLALVFPPSGGVSGQLRASNGGPESQADVDLTSTNSPPTEAFVSQPVFNFSHVPLGRFALQGCDVNTFVCASATGQIAGNGSVVNVAFNLPATGTVVGTVFAADGLTPVPNVFVQVYGGSFGPLGQFQFFGQADGTGHYSAPGVPAGLVSVVALDPVRFNIVGVQTGTLVESGSLTLNVAGGTAASSCQQTLPTTAGFEYNIDCQGRLLGGGGEAGGLPQSFSIASTLRIDGVAAQSGIATTLEAGGRQVVTTPVQLAGVQVTRKIFVPAGGAFARFLDTLANPSTAPVTVDVEFSHALADVIRTVVDPSATGNTYAVLLADPVTSVDQTVTRRPALGLVFAGSGAVVPASDVRLQHLLGDTHYRYTLTIPAGGSMTLMHFVVERDPAATSAVDAEAQALATLSDPDALANTSATERARVVNFRIP